jgi:hypothetical protein
MEISPTEMGRIFYECLKGDSSIYCCLSCNPENYATRNPKVDNPIDYPIKVSTLPSVYMTSIPQPSQSSDHDWRPGRKAKSWVCPIYHLAISNMAGKSLLSMGM